ncbi:MAG: diguanylate cyclase [Burkholderiales bacterium]|nr:diguanylate cyclase [Burkholderiales bacterium]
MVDDDPVIIHRISRILSEVATLRFATNGEAALRLARVAVPDLILLDSEMPGMSGFEICEILKADPEFADVPVIFVTSHSDTALHVAGLELGAVDFIAKPISEPLLLVRVKTQLRIKHLTDELRRTSTVDALTGLANRRRLDERLEREWLRSLRDKDPIALLLVDVDFFKLYNDHYGHPEGDACLQAVARVLMESCQRPADLAARYGGEEFALLLPQTTLAGAQLVAQRVLDAMARQALPHAASSIANHVTVSVGIGYVDVPGSESQVRDLVAVADQALYAAKSAGRAQAWHMGTAPLQLPAPAVGHGPTTLRPHSPPDLPAT